MNAAEGARTMNAAEGARTRLTQTYAEARTLHPALPARVEMIDCTLRDGEQAPGVSFSVEEKIELASALIEAGIQVLDAGFPAASGADREAMQAIAGSSPSVSLAATARPIGSDIAAAETARASEVFLFMPTSDARLHRTLNISREQAEQKLFGGIEEALTRALRVSVVFEDATRADVEWMMELLEEAIRRFEIARVVLADSVGRACPARTAGLFGAFHDRFGACVTLCTHSHNDFGLATSNTLAAIAAGARAATTTVNGIGERAGNADLAETVAALTHLYGVEHGVAPGRLSALSRMVERMSGIHMSALKPVTGFNVFRHESGAHVDAMLKDATSYEFLPSDWLEREREYVLGKHSGVALAKKLIAESGWPPDDDVARAMVAEAKRVAENRDKTDHEHTLRLHVDAMRRLLAGVDPSRLESAAHLSTPPPPSPPARMAPREEDEEPLTEGT